MLFVFVETHAFVFEIQITDFYKIYKKVVFLTWTFLMDLKHVLELYKNTKDCSKCFFFEWYCLQSDWKGIRHFVLKIWRFDSKKFFDQFC